MVVISVVIPTVLRESVSAAIQSVRLQSSKVDFEIIVVIDRSRDALPKSALDVVSDADLLLFTGGNQGAPSARNLGVSAATGQWVAFLDDDDVWDENKIHHQLAAAASISSHDLVVVSGRVRQRSADGVTSRPIPDRLYVDGKVEDYLFKKRSASIGRESLFTSTLLVTRELATTIAWDESLTRHQDWDWLAKAKAVGGVIIQVPQTCSVQNVGSTNSISASSDWNASLRWSKRWKHSWNKKTYVDFIVAQPMRYAMQARSLRGVLMCVKEVLDAHTLPSVGPALIGLAGMMPRKSMESLMIAKGKKGSMSHEA